MGKKKSTSKLAKQLTEALNDTLKWYKGEKKLRVTYAKKTQIHKDKTKYTRKRKHKKKLDN